MLSLSGQNGASEGIVFVSINYRLGALGWMSGTDFEHAGGLPNAGLYDQRMALEWVQENIHYFGGDKNRVTVVGESGGSGSITHHIAAYGAAPRSGSKFPAISPSRKRKHSRTRSQPQHRCTHDREHAPTTKNHGYSAYPGLVLTPPLHDAASFLPHYFSTLNDSALSFLTDILYPPIYNGSQPYHDLISRTALIIGDAVINCTAHALSAAFANSSYAYIFAVSGLHGQDIGYTFYRPGVSQSVGTPVDVGPVDGGAADILQNWIVSFASIGKPLGVVEGLAEFSPCMGMKVIF
ncbi:Alpha/Beta hydrolase protein [Macrophomina phaseolina]|uniref:Carboxylic ester hydrolase n=1 Tax=Macrophomina phaseolina TaxID=35725 RepID=A0ABQ8GH10_9PEZI|nr:Alpha/Beta hydrolase protein [Macrophomina phaseolina]